MDANASTIRVNLAQRSYDIEIGEGNLAATGRFLADRAEATHVVLVTDDNVHKPHAMRAAESLGRRDIDVDVIVVEPGEESKSIDVAAELWQAMLDLGADRKTVLAAVGGGVVGDLAGFIAATFARGLPLLQIPTSLLAQVDSSVGGKVGINLPDAKNMIGAFHQPLGVLVDTAVLATLPDAEYRNGLAEVVKYGAALDAEFFEYLELSAAAILDRRHDVLMHAIARCCRLKADLVERDEREESGLRAVLNFGHTFGHAFEMLSRTAVAISPLPAGEGPGVRAAGIGENASANPVPGGPHPNPLPEGEGTSAISPLPPPGEGPGVRAAGIEPLRHGEAVSIGMMCAARLAERMGRVDARFVKRLCRLLSAFGLPVEARASIPPKSSTSCCTTRKPSTTGCGWFCRVAWAAWN